MSAARRRPRGALRTFELLGNLAEVERKRRAVRGDDAGAEDGEHRVRAHFDETTAVGAAKCERNE